MVKTTNETTQKNVYVQILFRYFQSEVISQFLAILHSIYAGLLTKVNNWILSSFQEMYFIYQVRKLTDSSVENWRYPLAMHASMKFSAVFLMIYSYFNVCPFN